MYPEKHLSFIDHLAELRTRIIVCLVSVCVCAIVAYVYFDFLFALLIHPAEAHITQLYFFSPQAAFIIRLKVSFLYGLIAAVPILFYQSWMFVYPGLLSRERRLLLPMSLIGTILFFTGAVFCYVIVLPVSVQFLLGFAGTTLTPMIAADKYVFFAFMLVIAFGILFLLPIVVYLLSRLNILSARLLAKQRRYVLIALFIIAAVITPPDVFTQVILALPMYALFEISVFVVKLIEKKK